MNYGVMLAQLISSQALLMSSDTRGPSVACGDQQHIQLSYIVFAVSC